MARVHIPSLMRDLTRGQEWIDVPGWTVGQVIDALDRTHPGIRGRLCQGNRLGPAVQASVDGRIAVRGLSEPVGEESEVLFLPAVAGG
ncbi:MAG: MoaD/ThiS family protein [Anaerolineae bacterium]|nr:MoaD/ThiS family protein [Anaerolineae bacterium]